MFTGPVGPLEVFFYWPEAVLGNFYWPGAIGSPLASSPVELRTLLSRISWMKLNSVVTSSRSWIYVLNCADTSFEFP